MDAFSRFELLIGQNSIQDLSKKTVAIFGIGGVGGYACEALARSGIGHLVLIDDDMVHITNINRQIIADMDNIGKYKVDVMKERIKKINPNASVTTYKCFFLPETENNIDFTSFNYVIDAIDTISGKLAIILKCHSMNIPVISCMGTGNKLNPTMLEVSDVFKTSVCPLARTMRHELKKRGISELKVVYSKEVPIEPMHKEYNQQKLIPGSSPFVPAVAGIILASEVVKSFIHIEDNKNGR